MVTVATSESTWMPPPSPLPPLAWLSVKVVPDTVTSPEVATPPPGLVLVPGEGDSGERDRARGVLEDTAAGVLVTPLVTVMFSIVIGSCV